MVFQLSLLILLTTHPLILYRDLIHSCIEYASHLWRSSNHTALLNRMKSKAFCLINSIPPTDYLQPLSHCYIVASLLLVSTAIVISTTPLILLTSHLLLSHSLAAQDVFFFTPILSTLIQELISSIHNLSFFSLELPACFCNFTF